MGARPAVMTYAELEARVDVLRTWGFDRADIDRLIADGVVVCQPESDH